jgi:hypothetical protein
MPRPTEVRNRSIPEITSFHQERMPPAIDITPSKTNVPVSIVIGPAPSVVAEPINITANQMAAIDAIMRPAHLRGLIRLEW